MRRNLKVNADSLYKELLRICDQKGISFNELAALAGIDKNTLYRLDQQDIAGGRQNKSVQLGTIRKIADALNLLYKIDNQRNVTFINNMNVEDEYQESRRIGLKNQIVEKLDEMSDSSLENMLEILIAMKEPGRLDNAHQRENSYQPFEK